MCGMSMSGAVHRTYTTVQPYTVDGGTGSTDTVLGSVPTIKLLNAKRILTR